MYIPPDIERIFAKPGVVWSHEERLRVKEWLYEPPQLGYLRRFALRVLGAAASWENAEDAWGEFVSRRLDAVIVRYRPQPAFWQFLLVCFKRFCIDEREKIIRESWHETSADAETEESKLIIELADQEGDPAQILERAEQERERRAVLRALEDCMRTLPPQHLTVIIMFYFEDRSCQEIAAALGTSVSATKVRLYRARQALVKCLHQKGVAL